MNKKRIFALLLHLCLLIAVLTSCSEPQPPEAPPEEDETAQQSGVLVDFSAATLDGGTFTQDNIQEKDVTIINLWALTCGPCIAEMPDLAAYAKSLPDHVQLITVCLDGSGNEELLNDFLQTVGYEGVTIISQDGDLKELCDHLPYTPTTIFIDSAGQMTVDPIVGRQKDLPGTYTAAVNQVLSAGGKAEIGLAE